MLALIPTDQAIQAIDKAAQASDRWLFLAMLVIILTAGFLAIRYLIRAGETQQSQHHTFFTTVFTESVKLTAQVAVILQDNNKLLERLDKHLDRTEHKPHGHT